MQSITIAGRIGGDAEAKQTGKGSVTSFTVAVDQRAGRDKTTNWWRCSFWGARGDAVASYIRKGDNITVSGSFVLGEYNGKPQLDLNVSDLTLQGGKGNVGNEQRQEAKPAAADLDDDIPF